MRGFLVDKRPNQCHPSGRKKHAQSDDRKSDLITILSNQVQSFRHQAEHNTKNH